MKTKLSLLIATIATSMTLTYLQSEPTLAQSKQRFYCGSTDQQEPATMLVTQGQREEKTFVVWRAKTKDCKSVSRLFQQALDRGNRSFFAGETSKGKGSICSVRPKGKSCLTKDVLFEVDNKTQAQGFASQLESIRNGQGNSPIEQ